MVFDVWGVIMLLVGALVAGHPGPMEGAVQALPTRAVFTVYMAPADEGGHDAHDGLTPDRAVATLMRVQGVLREHDPETDVEVRIAPGTYVQPPIWEWRYYVPGRTISFLPVDYEYGDDTVDERPVFRNTKCGKKYCHGYWFQARLPVDREHQLYDGGLAGLRFYHLRVEYYSAGGVSIFGDSERDYLDKRYRPALWKKGSAGLNGNVFVGMRFHRLGNKWSGGKYGYGGIVLTNSSHNQIVGNEFVALENARPRAAYIHGVYVTHFSSSNEIERNHFERNSGDPVKVRDQSNYNTIQRNTFVRSGVNSYYRGEFCDRRCALAYDYDRQCASYHNRFVHNRLLGGYDRKRIPAWTLGPDGLRNAGEAPCELPPGERRLVTGGNHTR